jgi:hypothetical protein
MKRIASWHKRFDIESEIEYLGTTNEVDHRFRITRVESTSPYDPEEDECTITIDKHTVVGYMDYLVDPSHEEMEMMIEILNEMHICHK